VLTETVGREFDVVAISFDARETPALANGKKKANLDRYKRPESAHGWHFLTGDEAAIQAVTAAAGFKFAWDEQTQQFAHPSGIIVATPEGKLSRYFFGIDYAPRDVKFALMESSAGRIGNAVDQLLLYCYHYDPASGSYGFVAMGAVRIGGALTVLALVSFVVCRFGARCAPGFNLCLYSVSRSFRSRRPRSRWTSMRSTSSSSRCRRSLPCSWRSWWSSSASSTTASAPTRSARASKATCRWSCCGASFRP
jgi:hypothetical protein